MSNIKSLGKKNSLTAIIQTTTNCPMFCDYCSGDNDSPLSTMDYTTLGNILNALAVYNEPFGASHIIWFGGEPLMAGLGFFEKIVELEQAFENHGFSNGIQTNAVLLNRDFLELFREYGFDVGISMDGIKDTHDMNRKDKRGRGTFDTVFRNMELAREYGVGGKSFLCVVNKNTIDYLGEIYQFAKENGLHPKFNPQVPSGRAAFRPDLAITPAEYATAMIKLFDVWFNDVAEPGIQINPFNLYINTSKVYKNMVAELEKDASILSVVKNSFVDFTNDALKLQERTSCNQSNHCFTSYIGVSPSGDVTTCNRFAGDKRFVYGNINESDIKTMLMNQLEKESPIALRTTLGVSDCIPCEYKSMCNGGCSHAGYVMNGDILKPDGFCSAYKEIFKHIDDVLIQKMEG